MSKLSKIAFTGAIVLSATIFSANPSSAFGGGHGGGGGGTGGGHLGGFGGGHPGGFGGGHPGGLGGGGRVFTGRSVGFDRGVGGTRAFRRGGFTAADTIAIQLVMRPGSAMTAIEEG